MHISWKGQAASFDGAASVTHLGSQLSIRHGIPYMAACKCLRYLNINDDQKRTVSELRSCLTEKGIVVNGIDDDFSFLRFLKAREWDVQKAATMYEVSIQVAQKSLLPHFSSGSTQRAIPTADRSPGANHPH